MKIDLITMKLSSAGVSSISSRVQDCQVDTDVN